jgi:pimeloyl-ACP methyl ester carboxylesterase
LTILFQYFTPRLLFLLSQFREAKQITRTSQFRTKRERERGIQDQNIDTQTETMDGHLKTAETPALSIKYHDYGPADGWPVVLSHGFPYAPSVFDDVVPLLLHRGARVLVPYLRGFGPTRFRDGDGDGRDSGSNGSSSTQLQQQPPPQRSGQQAALGADLLALMDVVLGCPEEDDEEDEPDKDNKKKKIKPVVAGFDWGGVASCVVAALWPERVAGLVSYAGYDIVDVASQASPASPLLESVMWYQHLASYFLFNEPSTPSS